MTFRLTFAPLRLFCLPPGGTVDEPCYDDLPAAVESNDSSSAEEVQVSRITMRLIPNPFTTEQGETPP